MKATDLPCTIDGCDKRIYYGGLCKHHMNRKKTAGDPLAPKPPTRYKTYDCQEPECLNVAVSRHIGKCSTHHITKTCRMCKTEQPLDQFNKNKNSADNLAYECRTCVHTATLARRDQPKVEPEHERPCFTCDQWLHPSQFHKDAHNWDGLSNYCRTCHAARYETIKWAKIEQDWKLTREQWEALAKDGCMICGFKGKRLAVDHDHSCCPGKTSCGRCVRGILCFQHNIGLGYFQDNPETLQKAQKYLEMASQKASNGP